MIDGRCRFGPRAKREMVARLLAGEPARAIARSMRCSPATVTTTRDRWFAASEQDRASGAWCLPRRPVPRSCPWKLSAREEQRILEARARTNWGPMRLQAITGRHRSTIGRVLARHGVSRRRRAQRQTFRRFEWSQPGALLHIDAYSAPKFLAPGHRVTGERDKNQRAYGLGKTVVIAVQDDHSRIVYAELHSAENAANVSVTLRRGAAWMREQGCGPLEAVMSDNAKCYTGHQFAATLTELGARHIRIPPYTPRWNGKLCVLASRCRPVGRRGSPRPVA
jgi:transposase InsO family protein